MTKSSLKIEDPDVWLVTPTPGYVLKFRNVKMASALLEEGGEERRKCFVNVTHCAQLPPPMEIPDEEELVRRIDAGDTTYRVPLSVGELDCVRDHNDENSVKIDVLVNSGFYAKCLATSGGSKFYQHLFTMVMCGAISEKHHVELNPNEAIRLQNRRQMGEIEAMRVKKRPKSAEIQEIQETDQLNEIQDSVQKMKIEETSLPKLDQLAPLSGLKMRLFDGRRLEIVMDLSDVQPPVDNEARLRLDVARFDVRLLLDGRRSLFHFSVPLPLNVDTAKSRLLVEKAKLVLSVELGFEN